MRGIDSSASPSPKSQTIPVTWLLYRRDDDEDDKSDGNANGGGFDDERDFVNLYSSIEQGKRSIAVLRELSDSHFVVSGHLLKQSQKDPNVWRRMYFVLSEYRLWVIGRVRQEFSYDGDVGTTTNHDVVSSSRVGSHSHQSIPINSC